MNIRRKTARRKEEGVSYKRIPPHSAQVPIVELEEMDEVVHPLKPQGPQIPPIPQDPRVPFVEGDMTNAKLRAVVMYLTQFMMAQAQVVTDHLVF